MPGSLVCGSQSYTVDADSLTVYEGLRLVLPPPFLGTERWARVLGSVQSSTPLARNLSRSSLGVVLGDDEQCRRVCHSIPGCNLITREPLAAECQLHSACLDEFQRALAQGRASLSTQPPPQGGGGTAGWGEQLTLHSSCARGAVTMLARRCAPRPKWHRLSYRLPVEGNMLGIIVARFASPQPSCSHSRSRSQVSAPTFDQVD